MDAASADRHTLVVYRGSERADATMSRLAGMLQHGDRLTVLSLAAQEPARSGCCDTRSVLWNRLCVERAEEELRRASRVVSRDRAVELDVLRYSGLRAADAVEQEAQRRGADEIVLADPGACLSRRDRRRLRTRSAVPVTEAHG